MYFTKICSPFHSNVFNVAWWHSEWILSSCIRMLLKACQMFVTFIYPYANGFANTTFSHCVKSVQLRSFFWSVISCIRTEYRKLQTRKNSVFGHFSRSLIWSYQLDLILYWSRSYICINILASTHIEPMFHFWTPEKVLKTVWFSEAFRW